jgi:hypothetical protein
MRPIDPLPLTSSSPTVSLWLGCPSFHERRFDISAEVREDVKGQNLAFTEIAKLVGENWQLLTPSQKEPYEAQAATDKERHITELAEYKKTDSYKEYVQYLADFKAKHGVAAGE